MSHTLVLSHREASLHDEKMVGGKAKNMAWMSRNLLPVPEWLVVTTDAFTTQLTSNKSDAWINGRLAGLSSESKELARVAEEIRKRITMTPLAGEIRAAIERELSRMPGYAESYFAVRSSAVGEDAAEASFAGQMDSFLYQKGIDAICQSVVQVFASAYTERVIRYRMNHGMSILDTKAAVIVQRMIESRVSGVFFTAHPITGSRKHGLISACYGTGEGIVSGLCNTDEFTVEMYGDDITRVINDKDCQLVFDREAGRGTKKIDTPVNLRNTPCVTDEEIGRIVELGRIISERLRSPQDIEWGIEGCNVYILQTRPVTSLPGPERPKGELVVWDNSNIQESYCGVTTPLTFSFAMRGYKSVYIQTYNAIGVPQKAIAEVSPAFTNLLGLIKGRIYYNINNWYRGLLVLPSFKTNKADMERMMGLQDPVDFVEEKELGFFQKMKKVPSLLITLYKFLSGFRKIDTLVAEFKERFSIEYKTIDRTRLHTLEMAELMDLLARLRTNLLGNWHTPIINDFYVMMMNGKMHRWIEKCGVENPSILQNNLMSGEEGIESTEPTKFLLGMCDYIRKKPELVSLMQGTSNEHLLAAMQTADPELHQKCLEYIELYGDRCMGELKLESITLRQNPAFIFAVLKNFLMRDDLTLATLTSNEMKFRDEAEKTAFGIIKKKFGRRKLRKFKKDLNKLRQSVKNRENMRLDRTRAFGLARDIYCEIGIQLALYGVLEEGRDIFYLTEDEIEAYMDGRSVQANFKPLVATRKVEFAAYEEEELPHHFSTYGPVYHHNKYEYKSTYEINESADTLKGIGCYPGIVEQNVKLIFSPEDELNLNGQILCTVRTDPGWAPLFPTAGGIIVERGSTLSHSAVVARELGIPAIVNIPGLTKIIQNGERVRMDGSSGIIERLNKGGDK